MTGSRQNWEKPSFLSHLPWYPSLWHLILSLTLSKECLLSFGSFSLPPMSQFGLAWKQSLRRGVGCRDSVWDGNSGNRRKKLQHGCYAGRLPVWASVAPKPIALHLSISSCPCTWAECKGLRTGSRMMQMGVVSLGRDHFTDFTRSCTLQLQLNSDFCRRIWTHFFWKVHPAEWQKCTVISPLSPEDSLDKKTSWCNMELPGCVIRWVPVCLVCCPQTLFLPHALFPFFFQNAAGWIHLVFR